MSVVRKTVTFTASEVKPNLLTGLTEEFLTRPSAIKLYASIAPASSVEVDLQVGNVSIAKDLSPGVKTAGILNRDEDLIASTVGSPNDRIQIRAREVLGSTASITYMLEIAELA